MNDDGAFMAGAITAVIIMCFMMWFALTATDNSWRQQIVDHGCAGWYLDSDSVKQWNWSKDEPKKCN